MHCLEIAFRKLFLYMKILIVGASGLVGGNCLTYFKSKGWDCLGTHFGFKTDHTSFFDTLELDNPQNPDFETFKPDYILNCGALTHVDYCEENPHESEQKTLIAQRNIIKLAQKLNAKLIYISTDYVFDGENGPYLEDDIQNPLSVYGKHKQLAEQETLAHSSLNLVLRITNVYGDEIRGKNFVARIISQIKNGDKLSLKLPIDQFATPVNAKDIARALYLLINDKKSGVYHIASTDYVNRVQLAQKVLSYYPEAHYDLIAIKTSELNQPAKRPLLGGLKSYKFLQEYPTFVFSNLDDYLKEKVQQ